MPVLVNLLIASIGLLLVPQAISILFSNQNLLLNVFKRLLDNNVKDQGLTKRIAALAAEAKP